MFGVFFYLKQISSLTENVTLLSEELCSRDMKMKESCGKQHVDQFCSLLRQNAVANTPAEALMGCSNYTPLMSTNTTLQNLPIRYCEALGKDYCIGSDKQGVVGMDSSSRLPIIDFPSSPLEGKLQVTGTSYHFTTKRIVKFCNTSEEPSQENKTHSKNYTENEVYSNLSHHEFVCS